MTTPPLQLLTLTVRHARRLNYEALGTLLGCNEHVATSLCRGDESVATMSVQAGIVHHAAKVLNVPQPQLEQWAMTPPHGRRGLAVTDAIAAALDDGNELVKLHRAAIARGMTTQGFAALVGVSRQRLWVLEHGGRGVGYDKAVHKARKVSPDV